LLNIVYFISTISDDMSLTLHVSPYEQFDALRAAMCISDQKHPFRLFAEI
jgi:hypothetical protein